MVLKLVKEFGDDATGHVGRGFALSDVSGVNLDARIGSLEFFGRRGLREDCMDRLQQCTCLNRLK